MRSRTITAGLAMFTMMFGAGNIVLPLALGRDVGTSVLISVIGFCLTAVVMPLIGVISMTLFKGDYRQFLGKLGAIPGALVLLLCMILIGPFAVIPRCITVAHAAAQWYFPELTIFMFSIMSGLLIFAMTLKKSKIVELFGKFLGPLKITLLSLIIILGFITARNGMTFKTPLCTAFKLGFVEGYGTLDLVAALFFTGLIYASLHAGMAGEVSNRTLAIMGAKAGVVGGILLGVVYIGFAVIASLYAPQLQGLDRAQILSALASLILGSYGGLIANITILLSTMTTAIAVTVIFAEFLSKEVAGRFFTYRVGLIISVLTAVAMANIGFNGIMSLIKPVIVIFYPAMLVLALANIAHKLFGFKYIKTSVFATLIIVLLLQFK